MLSCLIAKGVRSELSNLQGSKGKRVRNNTNIDAMPELPVCRSKAVTTYLLFGKLFNATLH